MITEQQISQVIGTTAVDADGDKIGAVSEVYLDDSSGRPEWATVKTGMFGTKETFIPLAQAELDGDSLRFPYDKSMVKDAPKIEAEGHLSPEEETELYRYYGVAEDTADDRGQHADPTDRTERTDGPTPPSAPRRPAPPSRARTSARTVGTPSAPSAATPPAPPPTTP